MSNIVTKQTLVDGILNLVVKVHINSDGSEEANRVLINASDYTPAFTHCKLMRLDYMLTGDFQGKIIWDGDPNVDIMALSNNQSGSHCFEDVGGIPNNALTPGRTGDILLETTNIANNDEITLTFYLKKKIDNIIGP